MLIRRTGEGQWHSPGVTAYSAERALQTVLLQSPNLLPGIEPGQSVAVDEMTVPGIGAVDIVVVDRHGAITLVECKRRENPEIRRAVIGQVLAYAGGVWGMSYEDFDSLFSARSSTPLAECIQGLGVEAWDEEVFRSEVANNLHEGRLRLIVAVDEITDELKRIIEYLNGHTDSGVEILALELAYVADEGVEILVPAVYGTEIVQRKPQRGSPRRWDETSFFTAVEERCSRQGYEGLRELHDWSLRHAHQVIWGTGQYPSLSMWFTVAGTGLSAWFATAWPTNVFLQINFAAMRQKSVDASTMTSFAERLRSIPGGAEGLAGLEEADFNKTPSFLVDDFLAETDSLSKFKEALADLLGSG